MNQMNVWGMTDIGLVRKENQDAYVTAQHTASGRTVGVVCDGMGGPAGGRVASRIAVSVYLEELEKLLTADQDPQQLLEASTKAVSLANQAIQEEAERRVPVGTPAVFRGGCFPLGQELICGKSLDDRACFAALLGALELLKDRRLDVDLYVLGSVCEEVDSTGAVTAAYGVVPDLCAAVDVTHGDSPDAPKEKTFPLGKGPVIGVGPNCTRWMEQRMRRKAEELGMAVQTEVMAGHSGTNGWPLQVSREGVATAVLSLPLRYMHTPIEVISRRDLEDLARLLAAFVEGIGEEAESR